MKLNILSGNTLKIIAAVSMLIDHMGVLLFPGVQIFRILGRLAFPIFAFMISEGARYTKNKRRYLLTIAALAVICQTVYILTGSFEPFNILITFTFSIILIYSLQDFKLKLFSKNSTTAAKTVSGSIFICLTVLIYIVNNLVLVDYGFAGCLVPVFASLFDFRGIEAPKKLKKLDRLHVRVLCLYIGVTAVMLRNIIDRGDFLVSPFLLVSLPLLLLYSGKRGSAKLKYFFYLFYPLHLAGLQLVHMLLEVI